MCLRRTYAQSVVQGGREMGMQKEPPSIGGTGYSVWQKGYVVRRFVWWKEGRPTEVQRGSAGVDNSGPKVSVAVGGRLAVCIGIFHTINTLPLLSKRRSFQRETLGRNDIRHPSVTQSWTMLEEPGTGIGGGEHTEVPHHGWA